MAAVTQALVPCCDRPAIHEVERWPLVQMHHADISRLRFEPYRICQSDEFSGEALWVACSPPDTFIGLAFGWCSLAPGVLSVGNLLQVTTNALLLGENGVLSPSLQIAQCVRLVQSLPWRPEVLRKLQP